MGKSAPKIEVNLYHMSLHYGICAGPVDRIKRIVIKEKTAWEGSQASQGTWPIEEKDLFGGDKKEGGVAGNVTYLPGAADQILPDSLAVKLGRAGGTDCPGYRGLASLFMVGGTPSTRPGFYWGANSPYLPGTWIEVERAPVGLTFAYAMIPRLGTSQYPYATSSTSLTGSGVRWGFGGDYAAFSTVYGAIDWYNRETGALIGSTAGPGFAVGSVASVAFGEDGTAYFMGMILASGIFLAAAPPGGAAVLTSSDAVSFLFENTRVIGGVAYTSYADTAGYVAGATHVAHALRARDFSPDDDGDAWGLFQPDGASDSFTIENLTGTGSITFAGAVVRADVTHARMTFYGGNFFVHGDDGNFYIVSKATGLITAQGAAPWASPPVFEYGIASFWDTWSEYSLVDGSLRRTVDPADWLSGTATPTGYDSQSHAIWSRGSGGLVHVRYLDRGTLDANPAHIIYEALTNTDWGMGSPAALIDVPSFEAAGVTLHGESLGISLLWTRQAEIQKFIQEVLDHAQAVLFVDPSTGLLTLKLIRDDYDPEDLPEINPSNSDLSNFGRKLWGEITNEISVTWTNPENEQDETVTVHDLASIVTQGGIISDSRNYYGARSAELANRLALRDLRSSGAPLASCEAEVDRSFYAIRPASVVTVVWPEHGLGGVIMRVTGVDYGRPDDPTIKMSLLEDVFGLDPGDYTIPPGSIWEDPSSPPAALEETKIITLPLYLAADTAAAAFITSPAYPEVLAGVLASTSNEDTYSYELYDEIVQPDGSLEWESLGTNNIVGHAELTDPLPAEAESASVSFSSLIGQTVPTQGGFALIGDGTEEEDEIALITAAGGTYTLSRGVLDTVPKEWPVGTPVWFVDGETLYEDPVIRSAGEEVSYKLRSRTSQGLLSLGAAPLVTATLTERPWLPNRPANVAVDGVLFNTVDDPVDMTARPDPWVTVSWSNRNRLLEDGQVLGWTDATMALEDGQTTTVEVLAVDGTTVLATHDGLTGTSFDVPDASFSGHSVVIIRALAERTDADGTFESLQGHGIFVQVGFASFDETGITFDADTLTWDAG